ncbi:hypothetical protein BOTBODRAFT_114425, partial [Botryobasidium botryosum FD-172 SS1]
QSFVRTLDDLHGVTHTANLVHQFSSAFDIFIHILRVIDRRIACCLKRDDSDWRLKNACPCCSYKVRSILSISYPSASLFTFRNSAKYPLAITRKLLDILGHNLGIGYDIGCAFCATLRRTCLAHDVQSKNLRYFCGVFHGFAHNRLCQLQHLARNIEGCGYEDFETCERVFSASNHLAPLTRYASPYHRKEAIDAHFRLWDSEKYRNLGTQTSGLFHGQY